MKRLEKEYRVKAAASDFLSALTDKTIVAQWSGADAMIRKQEGSKFSLWGGSIVGVNKKILADRLVQLWKESQWEDYSVVTFKWREEPDELVITLIHENIPVESFKSVRRGWDDYYMNPLITWLESNNL